ncbi:nucleolus and neural progenitor protein-like [Xenentodon cancila]
MDKFEEENVKVAFGTKRLDAALCVPASVKDPQTAVILTHGAGGDSNSRQLVSLARALAGNGFLCLRFTCKGFNLVYRVKAYHAVWDYLKSQQRFRIKRMFFGGRSMGCRAAAALARQLSHDAEDAVQGVICLSFPLHPPGQTHTHLQRSADLRMLPEGMHVLFVSGTEDSMYDRVICDELLTNMKAKVEMFWLQGGSHGLMVKGSMAGEPWNRVNIPFPSVVSAVRIRFTSTTAENVETLIAENEKVLKLVRSEVLQTEIRVLYELLYILNNSLGGNRTFKGLQQVEQCINRLKNMKLDAALQELADLCPNRIQRGLSIKAGECDVPSQPMLEWICLKVLGAAQLLSCTLQRCSRAFILSKQQMKWEFIILNVVITSMLSRLWVIFRGVLVSLPTLYQQILELLRYVSDAQPMPYLTGISLPKDLVQFLGPSQALLLKKCPARDSHTKHQKAKHPRMSKTSVKVMTQKQMGRKKEDLGVAVKRDLGIHADTEPLKIFRKVKSFLEESHKTDKRRKFKEQVRVATTFAHMSACLEEMIQWSKSQGMEKEQRLLSFLRLKCQKMKCLEAAGYNVQRKLRPFRQEVCWASSPERSAHKICGSPSAMTGNPHLESRLRSLKAQFMFSRVRAAVRKTRMVGKKRKTWLPECGRLEDDQRGGGSDAMTLQNTDNDNCDDIDDIFASVGL